MEQSEKKQRKGFLSGYSKIEKKRLPFVALLLAFPILQFLVFYVYINIDSFILAFTNRRGEFSTHYLETMINRFSAVGDNNLWMSLGRSLKQWAISMFFNFPISILFTYALFKHVKGEMFFRVLFYLPGIIGSVVFGVVYKYLLAANGPIVELLTKMGMASEELAFHGLLRTTSTAFGSVNIFGIWLALGGNIVILTGAMTRIPTEIFESGSLEGVGVIREFFQLVLPLIWPTLSTLVIYQLGSISTFDFGTYLLYGESGVNYPVQTMGYYLFLMTFNVSRGVEVPNAPAALGLIMTICTVPVVLMLRWAIEKFSDKVEF
jgi:multiple sugar transport system permease protein/N-acetylglucosamine transport system permease protein